MRLNAVKVLEIRISKDSTEQILEETQKYLENKSKINHQRSKIDLKPLVIVTPNPEQIVAAQTDKRFADILNRADVALPDGVGVVWASRLLNADPLRQTIPGVNFMKQLIKKAAKQGVGIGLIGGRDELAIKAFDCLRQSYPELKGWGQDGPEVAVDNSELIIDNSTRTQSYFRKLADQIIKNDTNLVFVGLGAPKQEYFIRAIVHQLSTINYQRPIVLMSVGGAFDEIAGQVATAPPVVVKLGLKWLWRLGNQPWRVRRQTALVRFILLVIWRVVTG